MHAFLHDGGFMMSILIQQHCYIQILSHVEQKEHVLKFLEYCCTKHIRYKNYTGFQSFTNQMNLAIARSLYMV